MVMRMEGAVLKDRRRWMAGLEVQEGLDLEVLGEMVEVEGVDGRS